MTIVWSECCLWIGEKKLKLSRSYEVLTSIIEWPWKSKKLVYKCLD